MIIKICGLTRLEDVQTAVSLGADMLGFNFYPPSPRCLTPAQAAPLVAAMRAAGRRVLAVGIFVDMPLDDVRSVMAACDLDLAQLCGAEPPAALAALNGRAFKAIRPRTPAEATQQVAQFARAGTPPALLIDAYRPGAYGGTGHTGDWALAAGVARSHPILLAGGLTPANVATAVNQVQPWGVDVASGVESAPGIKDAGKMQQFITAARSEIRNRKSENSRGTHDA